MGLLQEPTGSPALTVCRDEYFHRSAERSDPSLGDRGDPHCARGIVDLNRNLSVAAIPADFFRQLVLGTNKKGKEMNHQAAQGTSPAPPQFLPRKSRPATSQEAVAMFPQPARHSGCSPRSRSAGARGGLAAVRAGTRRSEWQCRRLWRRGAWGTQATPEPPEPPRDAAQEPPCA